MCRGIGPLKIIAYLADPLSAGSSRYRVGQFLPYLRTAGVEVTIAPPAPESLFRRFSRTSSYIVKLVYYMTYFARRFFQVLEAGRFDAALVQRDLFPYGPPLFEYLLSIRNRRILYDTDDANFTVPRFAARTVFQRLRWLGKYALMMRLASRVTVVNEYLANYARRQNSNVRILPMAIDTHAYRPIEHRQRDGSSADTPVVIGWAGTRGGLRYLEELHDVFLKLTRSHNYVLSILTGSPHPPRLPGVPLRLVGWDREREISELRDFDIGIVPLADTDFDRGKFPFKMLQFMALGLPVVASAVGTPREVIEHGRTGFLASAKAQWVAALARLIEEPLLRERVGAAARRLVEERYAIEVLAPVLLAELKALGARDDG